MTKGQPFWLILQFAWPLLLGNMLQQFYSLVDAAIVGQYLGMNALAGVGASSSVLFLIIGFSSGCASGFGIPIAQAFGAEDYLQMRRYVRVGYYAGIVISILLALSCSLLCGHILRWMQTPEEIFSDAYTYLLITFITIPCNLVYNLLASVIRALGDSKTPFYFLVLASALNIVLDLLFIIVFNMGVGGAALATALAQTISIFICVRYMKRSFPILKGEMSQFNIYDVWIMLGFGIPFGLQFSITAIGSMMLQAANNALGTACATAFTAAMRIKMFFICAFENLGVAMATYCGQNLGARKLGRIVAGIKDAMAMMFVYWIITMAILLPFARDISTLFIYRSETRILDYSEQFLHISCVCYFFLGTLVIFRYTLQGLGYTRLAMWSGVSELIARALISLLVVPSLGFLGVCVGDPTAWMAANLFLFPAFYFIYQRLKKKLV